MRISDWSSDVCSSDLADGAQVLAGQQQFAGSGPFHRQQQAQQGTFTGTRVAGDKQKLATTDPKARLMQADVTVRIAFTDLFETNHECSRSADRKSTRLNSSH